MPHSNPIELPGWIFDRYRDAAADLPWIRLLAVHERALGEGQDYVQSRMSQAILQDPTTKQLEYTKQIAMRGPIKLEIDEWLEDDFDLKDWTRLELTCNLDGTNSAVVITEDGGPTAVDYMDFHHDPFWDYLDQHRDELELIAREQARS